LAVFLAAVRFVVDLRAVEKQLPTAARRYDQAGRALPDDFDVLDMIRKRHRLWKPDRLGFVGLEH